jgi:hypothetical protein
MTELKTLKDIEGGMGEYYEVFYKNLKAEAVKWVKEYKTHYDGYAEAGALMEFFNLTEEDLKGVIKI